MSGDVLHEANQRRTFAIISHPDAGKTTLTEKFLLYVATPEKYFVVSLSVHDRSFSMGAANMAGCGGRSTVKVTTSTAPAVHRTATA